MPQVVIQFTAFLMTLRKKGLLPPDAWKYLYAVMLASVRCSEYSPLGGWRDALLLLNRRMMGCASVTL